MRNKIYTSLSFFLVSFFMMNSMSILGQVQTKRGKLYQVQSPTIDKKRIKILHLKMSLKDGVETIELVDSKVMPGHLKEGFKTTLRKPHVDIDGHAHTDKELMCSILNENKKAILDYVVEYPLISTFEYPLSKSSGEMAHHVVVEDEKHFFIRIPHDQESKYLKLVTKSVQTKQSISEFEFLIH